jgi:GNAT superfamily N-acetyltransferase
VAPKRPIVTCCGRSCRISPRRSHRERSAFDRSFDALIGRADTLFLVAEFPGAAIAGYLLASHHGTLFANASVKWVEEVMVAAPVRRSGIGRALMPEAERWAADIPAAPRPRARLATTGALLNHQARTTYKVPPTGRALRSPREPKNAQRTWLRASREHTLLSHRTNRSDLAGAPT